jgi:predicted Zn-dependent protease
LPDLTRIRALLLTGTVAACVVVALPPARAANTPGDEQASAGTDLRKQAAELRQYLSNHPDDAAAHLKLGHLYVDGAKYGLAENEARAAQRIGGQYADDADALFAWTLFLESDENRLLAMVHPGNREPHDESVVRLSLGEVLLKTGSYDSAEPMLRDAVELDPSSWRAHMALAGFLILTRDLPEARKQVEAARAIAPDAIGVTRIAAELDRAEGNTDGAIAKFSEVIKSHPSGLPAWMGRADALISLDKLAEAKKDVDAAMRLDRHPEVIFLDALIRAREGQFDYANQELEYTTGVLSQMPIAYYLYGVVDFWLGHIEPADDYLARFQARQPNAAGVAPLRAEIALQRKNPASAIELLKPVVEANPADQEAATVLARAYLSNGQPDQVIALDEQLAAAPPHRKLAPVDATGLRMLYGDAVGDIMEIEKVIMRGAPEIVPAMAALRQGDIDKASQMAEPLSAAKPDDPWVQNLLGSVRLAQKRLPEAETIFRHVLEKRPDFTASSFNLVEVLVAEKRSDEAKAMLQDLAQRKLDNSSL